MNDRNLEITRRSGTFNYKSGKAIEQHKHVFCVFYSFLWGGHLSLFLPFVIFLHAVDTSSVTEAEVIMTTSESENDAKGNQYLYFNVT